MSGFFWPVPQAAAPSGWLFRRFPVVATGDNQGRPIIRGIPLLQTMKAKQGNFLTLSNHAARRPSAHFSRHKQKRRSVSGVLDLIWSGKRDSNSRPRPWQGRALPTELFPQKTTSCSSYLVEIVNVYQRFDGADFEAICISWQALFSKKVKFFTYLPKSPAAPNRHPINLKRANTVDEAFFWTNKNAAQ